MNDTIFIYLILADDKRYFSYLSCQKKLPYKFYSDKNNFSKTKDLIYFIYLFIR